MKCVVVGDASVGKTRLIITMATDSFSGPYIPTPFASQERKVMDEDGNEVNLVLQDTAWQEDSSCIRFQCFFFFQSSVYPSTCFDS